MGLVFCSWSLVGEPRCAGETALGLGEPRWAGGEPQLRHAGALPTARADHLLRPRPRGCATHPHALRAFGVRTVLALFRGRGRRRKHGLIGPSGGKRADVTKLIDVVPRVSATSQRHDSVAEDHSVCSLCPFRCPVVSVPYGPYLVSRAPVPSSPLPVSCGTCASVLSAVKHRGRGRSSIRPRRPLSTTPIQRGATM